MSGGAVSLSKNRSFNLLWSSQVLSDLGSNVSQLAYPLLALAVTGSAWQAGVVGTTAAVLRVAVRIPAGVLADRVNRRALMLTCDAVRLLAFLLLGALLVLDRAGLGVLLGVAALEGLCTGAFNVTERSALPSLVAASQVADATARNEAREAGTALVGPPLGGLLYGLGRSIPFFGDALSYLLSFVGVALIPQPLQQPRDTPPGAPLRDLAEGVRFVFREPFLRAILATAPVLNLAFNGMLFALILLFRQQGMAPGLIGTVGTIIGTAGLVGAIAASAIRRRFTLRALAMGISWLTVALIVVSAPLTGNLLAVVPIALAVMLIPAINSAFAGYQAAVTPDHLLGRVLGVDLTVSMSLAALGPLIAGVLVDQVGGFGTMLAFAAVAALGALTASFAKGIRTVAPIVEPAEQEQRQEQDAERGGEGGEPAAAATDPGGPHR